MLLGIHITDPEAADLRRHLRGNALFARTKAIAERHLSGQNAFRDIHPGPPHPPSLTHERMSPLAHSAAALSFLHAVEPSPVIEETLRNFLLWVLQQERLIHYGAFLQGQFLRGIILALDAVGQTMTEPQRRALLEHVILAAVDNPDPQAPVNNLPDRNAPLRRVMEFPGTGFHLRDEHINNWDVLGPMGLLYVARATEALLPGRARDVEVWAEVARRRIEKFFRLQYTEEGEYGEGPGYYSYGTAGAIMVLDLLRRWPRGRWWTDLPLRGLLASARWSREMQPREVVHGPFNFNDCCLGMHESPMVAHWIAARAKDPLAQGYGDELMKLALAPLDTDIASAAAGAGVALDSIVWSLLWRDDSVPLASENEKSTRSFGRFGTVISRTGYTSDDLCFWFRCGDLAGAHSHMDRGGFLLTAYGENIVSEAGRPHDRSIPEYMSYHRETLGHNIAMPHGQPQARTVGEQPCNGRITEFKALPEGLSLRADVSESYPGAGRVERRVRFSHRGWLLIQDFIEKPGQAIDFLLHTDNRDRRAELIVHSDRAILRRPNASLIVLPLLPAAIIDDGTHFQDADRDGLRSLILRRADQRLATLLVVAKAGEEGAVRVEPLDATRWKLAVNRHVGTIALA